MSFPRYAKYTNSGVEWLGEVPDHWEVRKLRDLARLESGHTPSRQRPDYWIEADCVIPWFTLADVNFLRDGRNSVIDSASQKISQVGMENSAARLLPPGTVLLSRTASVGFSGITSISLAVSQDFAAWICTSCIHPRFLLHCLRAMRPEFQRLMMGSTHQTIYMPDIVAFRVPVPPQSEQAGIIAFLDSETTRLDELITEQRRLTELLKEKRQAVISHAVTKGLNSKVPMRPSGIEWLGHVPEHWEVRRLKSLCSAISKGTTPTTIGADFASAGIRFLKAENITEHGVAVQPEFYISQLAHAALSRSALQEGDVLVVIAGATTGKSAVLTKEQLPANTNQAVSFVRPREKSISGYINLWLGTRLIRDLIVLNSVQSAQPNLSMEDLGNIPVPFPPLRELIQIVDFLVTELSKIDQLVTEAQRAIDLLQERRTALISAAVTGQIDVRGLVEAEAA